MINPCPNIKKGANPFRIRELLKFFIGDVVAVTSAFDRREAKRMKG